MGWTPKDWKNPRWQDAAKVHEWKNYISEEIQESWDAFTDKQKKMIARQAEDIAYREEWH